MAYALDAPDEQGGEPAAAAAARAPPLPLSVAPHQCSVRVSYWEQVGEVGFIDLVNCRTSQAACHLCLHLCLCLSPV